MFGRRKTSQEQTPTSPEGAGKNRPTPKRKDVEAGRKQPLVPANRSGSGKGASKETRQAAREQRLEARTRMMAGDERYLSARDRGPIRRFTREFVDSRWNLGELLLPIMVIVLLLSFFGGGNRSNPGIFGGLLAITYALVLMSAVDGFLMTLRLKRALRAKFGADVQTKGLSWYAVMRSFQIRRTRVPRPTIKRGQPPS